MMNFNLGKAFKNLKICPDILFCTGGNLDLGKFNDTSKVACIVSGREKKSEVLFSIRSKKQYSN